MKVSTVAKRLKFTRPASAARSSFRTCGLSRRFSNGGSLAFLGDDVFMLKIMIKSKAESILRP